jgi:hypothetical protein
VARRLFRPVALFAGFDWKTKKKYLKSFGFSLKPKMKNNVEKRKNVS